MSEGDRSGVVPVDKPVGPTSHDVVAAARRALGVRRIGHTGTLDPFASGLLLLCVGRATRLVEFLTGEDKSYVATARLGVATDTEDLQGEPVSTSDDWASLTREQVEAALASFRGRQLQTPPRYSAKKVDGQPAHRRVRRGEDVTLEPREITVHEIEMLELSLPNVRFAVRCSSGTYVRSLARDLGERLAVGGHLTELRRTHIGSRSVDGAASLDDLAALAEDRWIGLLDAVGHLPRVEVEHEASASLRAGRSVPVEVPDGPTVVAARGDVLVAIGAVAEGIFRPRKVLDV